MRDKARDFRQEHWDAAYRDRGPRGVSWFQSSSTVSLELIELLAIRRDAAIVDVGGGTSTLVDELVAIGFRDLTVVDISDVALNLVRARLADDAPVSLEQADLLSWDPARRFDLWHDRAVFHFLVDEADRRSYLEVLRSSLQPGGAVILATFAEDGPASCSGLPVARYGPLDLSATLGPGFELVEQVREEHVTPGGVTQPFTWVAARAR